MGEAGSLSRWTRGTYWLRIGAVCLDGLGFDRQPRLSSVDAGAKVSNSAVLHIVSVEERDDVAAVADHNMSGLDRRWAKLLCPLGLNGGRSSGNFGLEWTRW